MTTPQSPSRSSHFSLAPWSSLHRTLKLHFLSVQGQLDDILVAEPWQTQRRDGAAYQFPGRLVLGIKIFKNLLSLKLYFLCTRWGHMSSRETCALIFKCLYTAHTGTKKIPPAVSTHSPISTRYSNHHLPSPLAADISFAVQLCECSQAMAHVW